MPKRRGRGEGSISRRKDGTWHARISAGVVKGVRRVLHAYGKTKEEALGKLRKLQNETGTRVPVSSRFLLRDFLERWLAEAVKPTAAPSTYYRYEGVCRNHLAPALGSVRLDKLTPSHVATVATIPGSAWTRRRSAITLKTALSYAVRMGYILANPADGIAITRLPASEIGVLTDDEARRFLEHAACSELYALFALALGTGMRLGELLALRWDDFAGDAVSVRRSLSQVRGFKIKEPKSTKSRRRISLPQYCLEAVAAHPRTASPYLFTTSTGGFLSESNLRKRVFLPLCAAAGVSIRFHDLRHTHASALLRAGAHPKAVSSRLGHSTVEFTLRVYAHLLPDADAGLADAAEKIFRKKD